AAQPNMGPIIVRVTTPAGGKAFAKTIFCKPEAAIQYSGTGARLFGCQTRKDDTARKPMPRISIQEFERLPLRVHDFLAGVPLHDAWAIDLPASRSGITLDEFLRAAKSRSRTSPPLVRALLNVRFCAGRLFELDREPAED